MNALPKLLKLSLIPILAASLNAASTYKVQAGDTLSSIARKNGTTPSKLMSDNGISDPNKLLVGQTLKVGGSSSTAAKKTTTSSASRSTGSGNHTIKTGETLYSIARSNGMTVSQITALNPGLDPSKLSVGQKINTKVGSTPKKKTNTTPPKKKETPAPAKKAPVIAQTEVKLTNAPSPALVIEAPKETAKVAKKEPVEQPSSISSILVEKEIAFGALASRHRTSTQQLNELNGWRLKPTTVLAKGSEVYVPGS